MESIAPAWCFGGGGLPGGGETESSVYRWQLALREGGPEGLANRTGVPSGFASAPAGEELEQAALGFPERYPQLGAPSAMY